MSPAVQTLELRWHFPHDIDSGAHGLLSGKDIDRPAPVVSVHWHPFEYKLLTSGFDGSAKVWTFDPSAGLSDSIRHVSTMFLHEKSSCNCVRWSPDGHTIAAGYNSGEVVLWRRVAEKHLDAAMPANHIEHKTDLNGSKDSRSAITDSVSTAAVALRSQPFGFAKPKTSGPTAQSAWNYEYNVEAWHAVKVIRVFGETEVYAVGFSCDGTLLGSGSQEGYFVVHDLVNGYHKLRVDHKHVGPIQGIAWDPLGKYFTTIGADRKCFVYGVSRQPEKDPAIHVHDTISRSDQGRWLFRGQDATPFYRHGSFSPDGLLLAAPCGWFVPLSGDPKKQNETNGRDPQMINSPSPGQDPVEPSSNVSHNCTYIFLRHIFQKPYRALCISGDSPVIGAVFSPQIYALREVTESPQEIPCKATNWGPSEYAMAIAVFSNDVVNVFTTTHNGPVLHFSDMHLAPITCVAWCHDGKHLAISSDDGSCTLASVGDVLCPLNEPTNEVNDQIAADSDAIAAGESTQLRKIFLDHRLKLRGSLQENVAKVEDKVPPQQTTCIAVRRKEKT